MVWWIWFIVAGYVLLAAFVIWQMGYWIKHARPNEKLGKLKWIIPIISICSTFPIIGTFSPEGEFAAFFQMIGNVWLGILVAFGIVMFFALISRIFVRPVSTKYANIVIIIALGFTLVFNVYGAYHAKQIQIKYYQVAISSDGAKVVKTSDEAPGRDTLQSTRLAFISDNHMGVNSSLRHIQATVDAVNCSESDLVLGGGDYFTSSYVGLTDAEIVAEILSSMNATNGKYFALGNHDVTEKLFCGFAITTKEKAIRYPEMDYFFQAADWDVKEDEIVDVNGIQYVFRKDGEKTGDGINKRMSAQEIMAGLDTSRPIIVIEHEPDDLNELSELGADLVLSGHTHNGQIFPGNIYGQIDAARNDSNEYGAETFGKLVSIVSSGIGYYGPPLRIGTDSEVVIIDLITK